MRPASTADIMEVYFAQPQLSAGIAHTAIAGDNLQEELQPSFGLLGVLNFVGRCQSERHFDLIASFLD